MASPGTQGLSQMGHRVFRLAPSLVSCHHKACDAQISLKFPHTCQKFLLFPQLQWNCLGSGVKRTPSPDPILKRPWNRATLCSSCPVCWVLPGKPRRARLQEQVSRRLPSAAWSYSSGSQGQPHLSLPLPGLRENCWSRACRGPSALSGSWRPRLCAQELEGNRLFVCPCVVTVLVLAAVLAQGFEQQPCSHTSRVTAKAWHPLTAPTVRGREAFLTFFPEKRGEMSEFGGHHIIQIAI